MSDHIYKVIEVVGSSEVSTDDAVRKAIDRASATVDAIGWFEVTNVRGHVDDGKIAHFQVTLKIGFTLNEAPDRA